MEVFHRLEHNKLKEMRQIDLSDNSKAVEFLIKNGANVNVANKMNETALLQAAYHGNLSNEFIIKKV